MNKEELLKEHINIIEIIKLMIDRIQVNQVSHKLDLCAKDSLSHSKMGQHLKRFYLIVNYFNHPPSDQFEN